VDGHGYAILMIVLGFVFVLSIVPIVGGLLHARRERTLVHAERMKALELSRELPDDVATARIQAAFGQVPAPDKSVEEESLPAKCFSTAFWVAFWGFAGAAGLGGSNVSPGVAYAIAASTGAIGVTAMICGAILGARASAVSIPTRSAKHTIEDDALDVVSCRG
jgi:hypothetical protein